MEFGVSSETVETALVINVHGDVDLATAPILWEYLTAQWSGTTPLIANLAQVPFMDSTGLSVLVRAVEQANLDGGSVAVANASARVLKVMTITGLDTFIYIGESIAECVRATESR